MLYSVKRHLKGAIVRVTPEVLRTTEILSVSTFMRLGEEQDTLLKTRVTS